MVIQGNYMIIIFFPYSLDIDIRIESYDFDSDEEDDRSETLNYK